MKKSYINPADLCKIDALRSFREWVMVVSTFLEQNQEALWVMTKLIPRRDLSFSRVADTIVRFFGFCIFQELAV